MAKIFGLISVVIGIFIPISTFISLIYPRDILWYVVPVILCIVLYITVIITVISGIIAIVNNLKRR